MFEIARRCFSLPDSFLDKYKNKQPDWGPLGEITFRRTYARPVDGENRNEEYWETCRRVVEGTFSIQKNHCRQHILPWDERKAMRSAKLMFELMWNFKFLPPGRGLWTMGTDHVVRHGSASLNNCAFTSTSEIHEEFTKPFCFLMDMSMLGVGVGFDVQGGEREVLIVEPKENEPIILWTIEDSREGWVKSLHLLLHSFVTGKYVRFDYSKIRAAGLPIKGFGGVSSGPEPLKRLHEEIFELLSNRVGDYLRSSDIVDIMNFIGKCVVAGSVRRTAELSLGSPDDQEFLELKQDKKKLISHRWASNNSVVCKVGMDYEKVTKYTVVNGEPGFQWLDNARAYGRMVDPPDWRDKDVVGVNPCSEQSLHNMELCTLCETFPARHKDFEEYMETLKIAYLYAKTITLVPTHWEETNAVMQRNRRIGLSQSGIIQAFTRHGRREMLRWCDEGYSFLKGLDTLYSNWLCIPRSIKMTSVKPSGSVSLLCGATPGIHYPHSEYYIRRIRLGIFSPLIEPIKNAGYKVEPAIGQEDSTVVAEFPIQEKYFSRGKNEVSIWEQVSNAVAYQKYFADNQVSITATFRSDEKDDIKHILELYEDSLKSISFLPLVDHGYAQAPYEEITKEQYEDMIKNLKPIDFTGQIETEVPQFCDGDTCEVFAQ